jgi:hypothetical protein
MPRLTHVLIIGVLLWLEASARGEDDRSTSIGGFDTAMSAPDFLECVSQAPTSFSPASHPWMRVRGLPEPTPTNGPEVERQHDALRSLQARGFRMIALLRWSRGDWQSGERRGGGQRVPLDLREVYARAKALGAAYSDVLTAFEIENEPDISFVEENPETYLAFFKAAYLGLKSAHLERQESPGRALRKKLFPFFEWLSPVRRSSSPWVVMAPLALPPGPYFEQLVANGLLSYTDAVNYHFYGFAEDFTGTYRQFEDAVQSAGLSEAKAGQVRRSLPVILSEYGYGSLSDVGRHTAEGRERQWRWFRSVGQQAEKLRIAGPMAFVLPPYLESKAVEFGLIAPPRPAPLPAGPEEYVAGGVSYRRSGFTGTGPAARSDDDWMRGIGRPIGHGEATPALAWLLARAAQHPYQAHDWHVSARPPSPVVLDFVAGNGLVQLKRFNGYLATQASREGHWDGAGEIVLYNFSTAPVAGTLTLHLAPGLIFEELPGSARVVLAAGERRVIPLRLTLTSTRFQRVNWTLTYQPEPAGVPPATFTTAIYPEAGKMSETVYTRFDAGAGRSLKNRNGLSQRPLATEEETLVEKGRWRVTAGVTVKEMTNGGWRFEIAAFPGGQPRPSVAELPLADDFVFPDGGMMRFSYRLAEPAETTSENGRYCEAYFRTASGSLYQVWPRQYATSLWSEYTELKENYTMAFYGRANLPWRFRDNRVSAVVFCFRPITAPAAYEVKDARIVGLGRNP